MPAAPMIAQRYAQALLDLGLERKNYEQLGRELDRVVALFNESKELRELFRNPKFGAPLRKAVLSELLKLVLVSPLTRNFLLLLVDRGRIGHLDEVVRAYHDLADEHAGRLRAEVTVAATLSEPEAARLRTVLQKVTGRQVVLEQREDPTILGGLITRIGDRVYDGSVRAQLESLRSKLKHSTL